MKCSSFLQKSSPLSQGKSKQSVAADDPSRPGDEHPQESELATGEGDRVTGIAAEPAGIEIEDEAREAHRECGFPR
jgi:hypothetical protein